jgi:hypothetical protein
VPWSRSVSVAAAGIWTRSGSIVRANWPSSRRANLGARAPSVTKPASQQQQGDELLLELLAIDLLGGRVLVDRGGSGGADLGRYVRQVDRCTAAQRACGDETLLELANVERPTLAEQRSRRLGRDLHGVGLFGVTRSIRRTHCATYRAQRRKVVLAGSRTLQAGTDSPTRMSERSRSVTSCRGARVRR